MKRNTHSVDYWNFRGALTRRVLWEACKRQEIRCKIHMRLGTVHLDSDAEISNEFNINIDQDTDYLRCPSSHLGLKRFIRSFLRLKSAPHWSMSSRNRPLFSSLWVGMWGGGGLSGQLFTLNALRRKYLAAIVSWHPRNSVTRSAPPPPALDTPAGVAPTQIYGPVRTA